MSAIRDFLDLGSAKGTEPLPDAGEAHQAVIKTSIYCIPESVTDPIKKMVLIAVLASLCHSSEEDISLWRSWLLTITIALFPSLKRALEADGGFTFESLEQSFIDAVGAAIENGNRPDPVTPADPKVEYHDSALDTIRGPDFLPDGTVKYDMRFMEASGYETLYQWFSVIAFLMGYSQVGDDVGKITTTRTTAVMDKTQDKRLSYFATGDGALTLHSIRKICASWNSLPTLRERFIILALNHEGSRAMEWNFVWTNFKLVRWAHAKYVPLIRLWIAENPAVIDWPEAHQQLEVLTREFDKIRHDHPSLRPFRKVIGGDSAGLFPRADLAPIIYCSVLGLTRGDARSTLRAFHHPREPHPMVDRFEREFAAFVV